MSGSPSERHSVLKRMFKAYQMHLKKLTGQEPKPKSGMKYGVQCTVKEMKGADENEIEQFENVANARPAAVTMHTRSLKWKDESPTFDTVETLDTVGTVEDVDKTMATIDQDSPKSAPLLPAQKGRPRSRQLENELRRARETIIFLRSKLQRRDKKIQLLRSLLIKQEAELKRFRPNRISQIPPDDDESEFPDSQVKLAVEILEKFKRNQLLEKALSSDENKILTNYFMSARSYPTNEVVMLIDKAIGYALDTMVNRTELCDDFINNNQREFLMDTSNAKRVILDVMLTRLEFVPDNWGGRSVNTKKVPYKAQKSPRSTTSTSKTSASSSSSSSLNRTGRRSRK